MKFLVADDVRMNLVMAEVMLRSATAGACRVVKVASGEEALAQLQQHPRRFDVVMLDEDFGHGHLSGHEILAQMKGWLATQPTLTPPLFVNFSSRQSTPEYIAAMLRDGFDLVWPKCPLIAAEEAASQLKGALRSRSAATNAQPE